ncbi:rootletin-like [Uloborus diversus]|uniref:rootletin-like n=1 Tax=Uloborus diversus TaxID=327109 RepID=UPI00240919E6|nr:rootletin-like [Uloborus diversus]
MNEIISALREEKASLEKALYSCQKSTVDVHDEKSDLVRELDFQKSSVASLQAQIKELQDLHQAYIDDVAKEKEALTMKMNKIEQEFQIILHNERHQHNVDIDILTQEKEALRGRLVSVVDECFDSQQKRLEEVQSSHQEEIAALKKKFSVLESEHEEKLQLLEEEKKRIDMDNKLQMEALERTIIDLKKELSEKEVIVSALEERVTVADREKQKVLQEKLQVQQNLKDEINNMLLEHSKAIKDLENQVQDLKQQKEAAVQDLQNLEIKFKNSEHEKDKIAAELDELSSLSKNEKNSRVQLEDKIALLQNQLLDEKSLNEVVNRSLEDCKSRLKVAQAENMKFKNQIEETKQEMNDFVSINNKLLSQNAEYKATLKDVVHSRQETKRELQNLQRKMQILEQDLNSKDYEITELSILQGRQEEKEEELKREIVSLKQKVLESNSSNVAAMKEMAQSKQKLSGLEHKLKVQEEQHHSVLEECLSNEQSLSEHRLNLEKSVADATKEIQSLRSRLSFEEGKAAALESRVIKLDGSKREVENKMYSLCLFLRTCLGIGSDSGFSSSASNLLLSPWPLQKDAHNGSRSSVKDSPHRLNFSASGTAAQLTISDSDIELLKSTLMDLIEKFHAVEKEKDDLKDALSGLQKQDEELRNEHSRCIAKVYQLKRDLEDKKNVEKDLATKIASIHHHEEVIRTLEREKRRLTEKIGNAEFSLSALEKEKENLLDKTNEMKKFEDDLKTVSLAKETAESKALKYFKMYQNLEKDIAVLHETLNNKTLEIKLLEQNIEAGKKKLQACEERNKNLCSTIEQLNLAIENHIDTEKMLKDKVHSLSHSLSRNSASQQNLSEEYESARKERMKYQKEIFTLQSMLEQLKSTSEEFKLKNRILNDELENMRKNLRMSESAKEEFSDQIKRLQNDLVKAKDSEKEALDQVNKLREQKKNLEIRMTELNSSLREARAMYEVKEEMCEKLEMEVDMMRSDLNKIEKEKQMTSELTAKSLVEKSSLGRTLTKLEIENQALQIKVQNLQAQLAELEERHAQRVKDFLDSQKLESKLEDERIKRALKQTRQLMEAKEKTYHQKVLGLEEQIKVLKEHLEKEKQKWQRYHERSLHTNSNINYLHSVLSKSLQNVSEDPQKLLPEAERLDLTTEIQLNASGASISTPSKFSRTPSFIHHKASTPRIGTPLSSRRKLDFSKT